MAAAPAIADMSGPDCESGWRLYSQVLREELSYSAVPGDNLLRIAGKLGVDLKVLLTQNQREGDLVLPGDTYRSTRHIIIPAEVYEGIVVNIPDRMLYLFRDGGLKCVYTVGLGRPDWQTPEGRFSVLAKSENPTWHVPASIQAEMAEEGKPVKTRVGPGPDNPLGRWALRTSIPGILIHETNYPESVYRFSSHGCIRMRGEDVESLFNIITDGETGRIIYRPVKLALTTYGSVYLEVHADAYNISEDQLNVASEYIISSGLAGMVDWNKVSDVVSRKEGVAEDVTLRTADTSRYGKER